MRALRYSTVDKRSGGMCVAGQGEEGGEERVKPKNDFCESTTKLFHTAMLVFFFFFCWW